MHRDPFFPLDYRRADYPYLERANPVLIQLVRQLVLGEERAPRIVDIGCGAGANGRALRKLCPDATLVGIEPNAHAAGLARKVFDTVHQATADEWLASAPAEDYAAVILSDVLEHVVDPVDLLFRLSEVAGLRAACWVVSVPNFAVWHNRAGTLLGRFDYAWCGLYDRTHLRFFTRRSLRRLLEHCGFQVLADRCSPSLAQSTAPLLARFFEAQVQAGNTLALAESRAYGLYERFVQPVETQLCAAWPELLGFQIVLAARIGSR